MELTVTHLGNVKFEAESRGHRIICDQPLDNQGNDGGMSPPELLLASLATCVGFYAVQYFKVRNIECEGLKVKIAAEKELRPARLDRFKIVVEAPGVTGDTHVEGVRRSVEKCLIKNTLLSPPSIDVAIETPAPAVSR